MDTVPPADVSVDVFVNVTVLALFVTVTPVPPKILASVNDGDTPDETKDDPVAADANDGAVAASDTVTLTASVAYCTLALDDKPLIDTLGPKLVETNDVPVPTEAKELMTVFAAAAIVTDVASDDIVTFVPSSKPFVVMAGPVADDTNVCAAPVYDKVCTGVLIVISDAFCVTVTSPAPTILFRAIELDISDVPVPTDVVDVGVVTDSVKSVTLGVKVKPEPATKLLVFRFGPVPADTNEFAPPADVNVVTGTLITTLFDDGADTVTYGEFDDIDLIAKLGPVGFDIRVEPVPNVDNVLTTAAIEISESGVDVSVTPDPATKPNRPNGVNPDTMLEPKPTDVNVFTSVSMLIVFDVLETRAPLVAVKLLMLNVGPDPETISEVPAPKTDNEVTSAPSVTSEFVVLLVTPGPILILLSVRFGPDPPDTNDTPVPVGANDTLLPVIMKSSSPVNVGLIVMEPLLDVSDRSSNDGHAERLDTRDAPVPADDSVAPLVKFCKFTKPHKLL